MAPSFARVHGFSVRHVKLLWPLWPESVALWLPVWLVNRVDRVASERSQSSRAAHKLLFIIQDLVRNTILGAGLLVLQIKISFGDSFTRVIRGRNML